MSFGIVGETRYGAQGDTISLLRNSHAFGTVPINPNHNYP